MQENKKVIRTVYLSIAANTCLAILKWFTGFFGNSYALIADAIESTSDIFSSILLLFGLKFSTRPADENHPYGHGRAEPLITFVLVVFLVISAIVITYRSIYYINTPHDLPENYTLFVLGGIILSKEIFYRIILGRSKQSGSGALRAEAWHQRSDTITSLAAFAGILFALIMGEGYESADDWAALLAAGVIIYNAWFIFRAALGEIMDEQLYEKLILQIRSTSIKVDGVKKTEKCFVRKSGLSYYVDLHIEVDPLLSVRQGHEIAHHLKERLILEIPSIADVLIHIEPFENGDYTDKQHFF
jgi:cation diffusion facilitator family transporter